MLSFLRAQGKNNFKRSLFAVTSILKQKLLFCFVVFFLSISDIQCLVKIRSLSEKDL